jgi:Ca-activated chloride channel homolog
MEGDLPWYDLTWFSAQILKGFVWDQPGWLYGIFAVPLLVLLRWVFRYFFRQRLPIAYRSDKLRGGLVPLFRFVPDVLFAISLVVLLMAMARPQRTNERVEQWTEGIDISLVIDISRSMMIEDFKPNRMDAAKKVALEFIDGRFQDRIGLVIFAGDAYSLAPLTTDYDLLRAYIRDINFDMIDHRGTAIGSALAVATNRMRESTAKSKVCILLSDGENTAGNIDPITAAELAAAFDIKIYTIAIGKEGLVPFGKDYFGNVQMVENNLDETALREIAKIGNGNFYRVDNNRALELVFEQIDQLEKVEIQETRYKDTADFYHIYLSWGILFFLAWILLKPTFLSNALQE